MKLYISMGEFHWKRIDELDYGRSSQMKRKYETFIKQQQNTLKN